MNDINLNVNWNAVSSIASVLGFLAVLLTVLEMKNQRTHSYKPVLAIRKPFFVVENNAQGIPSIWKDSFDDDDNKGEMWIDFQLTNIGFGTANDIEIKWEIDFDVMLHRLEKENYGNMFTIYKNGNNVHFVYNGFGFFINKKDSDYEQELGFLQNGETLNIKLPMAIKSYLSFLYLAKVLNNGMNNISEEGIVPVIIKIRCKDISEKEVIKEIFMKYDLYVKSDCVNKPNENMIFGKLYFPKKSIKNRMKVLLGKKFG